MAAGEVNYHIRYVGQNDAIFGPLIRRKGVPGYASHSFLMMTD